MTTSTVPEPLRRDKRSQEGSGHAAPAPTSLRRDTRNPDSVSARSTNVNPRKPGPNR
jgi:hypothetical protein